ncbi:hypothetical protein J3R30DRAFT_3431884 [Lentinula aciculospora]|uniref:RING-type domain-containing protein n=1 Tax=Lentinula aciculospora TaxID=153920 RepID=A0A9W9DV24_9AGAR|nr:hypothetical protein J3R30DRAFT_3431884 [Lentinula aciculospora]
MSAEPTKSLDFDFWEFVCCAKCQLPYNSGASSSTVPFWLTECGHVICNNHLNPDQTCAQCKSSGIQLIPLQHDMELPMSEWFRSVPYMLDSAAYAVKFQQESMASQIRNLKARYQQQRGVIENLRKENAQLKQMNEMFTMQSIGMHNNGMRGHESATFLNANGKRQMIDISHPLLSSSPRSIATPVGPNRITLPPGQQPPQLSSNPAISPENMISQHQQRPGTNRFTQQFVYTPSQVTQTRPLTQLCDTPTAQKQLRKTVQQDNQISSASRSQMPPPHVKVNSLSYSNLKPSQTSHSSMGPPQFLRDTSEHLQTALHPADQMPNTKRFLSLSERFPRPVTPSGKSTISRRFIPPAAARSNFRPATSSLTNGTSNVPPTRGYPRLAGGSGQRTPFVPGQ